MSDFKFSCPLCDQHIRCESSLSGRQIVCPGCQGAIVIPQEAQEAPSPPPVRRAPLRVALPQVEPAGHVESAPAPPLPRSIAPKPRVGDPWAKSNREKTKSIITTVAVILVLGTGVFLAWPWVSSMQSKINQTREQAESEGGGQAGHIAELYQVLDDTDPNKMRGSTSRRSSKSSQEYEELAAAVTKERAEAKLIPAVWTLDLQSATIPGGKANGTISGTNFVVERAWLDRTASSYVLTLRQGTNFYADREILVYLRLKPGQVFEGNTWTVSSDMKTGVPQVAKRWQPSPRTAPQQKSFASGYALKLEFGQPDDGFLPGKIYVALPDAEKTVVAGNFSAALRLASAATAGRARAMAFDAE